MDDRPRLSPIWRSGLVLAGLILVAAAWPVAFLGMVFAGGGHTSPFAGPLSQQVFAAAMLVGPLMMIVVGIVCLAAINAWRARLAGLLALAIPLDAAVAAIALWETNRPPPPAGYLVPADKGLIGPARTVATGPTVVSIACSARTGKCVSKQESADRKPSSEVTSPAKP
jgi:hypothetical protein